MALGIKSGWFHGDKNSRTYYYLTLFFTLLVALLLRLPRMSQSLWLDEMYSTHLYLGDAFYALLTSLRREHLPFFYQFMFGWIHLFGDSEWSIRAPSLLAGLFSIPLTYAVASRLLGKTSGLLSAWIVALSPVHIWYSTESRLYSIASLFSLVSILAYWKLSERAKFGRWELIFFFTCLLMIFTHLYLALFLVVFIFWSFLDRSRARIRAGVMGVALLSILAIFLYFKNTLSSIPSGIFYLRPFSLIELWDLFFNWYLLGNSIWTMHPYLSRKLDYLLQNPWMTILQATACCLFLKGVVVLWRQDSGDRRSFGKEALSLLFSIPLFLLAVTFCGLKNVYIQRSCYMAMPFFYIVMVAGAMAFRNKAYRVIAGLFLVGLSLVALGGFLKKTDQATVDAYSADWRSVASFFSDEIKERDDRFMIYVKTEGSEPLSYHNERLLFERPRYTLEIQHMSVKIAHLLKVKFGAHDLSKKILGRLRKDKWLNLNNSYIPYMDMIDVPPDAEALQKIGISRIYIVEDLEWSDHTPELVERIKKRNQYRYSGVREFHGAKVYEFSLNNPAAG